MPVSLPFSIPYRQKRKPKPAKSPPSHSTSYTDVFDIHDSADPFRQLVPESSKSPQPLSDSPKLRLNFSSKDFSSHVSWFPRDLLEPDSTDYARPSTSSETALGLPSLDTNTSEEKSAYSDSAHSSPADVLAHLEALDASSFITVDTSDDFQSRANGSHSTISQITSYTTLPQMQSKRIVPAPILIPNTAFDSSKVQVVRSAQMRPHSFVSSEETSAVSGTTLARALLANSFVLSSDNRFRHRSDVSILTRQDSATLPHADSYMLNSPYSRRASFDDNPSMPLPSNAEHVYIPPKLSRSSTAEDVHNVARRSPSNRSLKLGCEPDSELPLPVLEKQTLDPESPVVNNTMTLTTHNDNIEMSPPLSSRTFGPKPPSSPVDTPLPPEPESPSSPMESPQNMSPRSIPDQTLSPKSIDTVLDYYSLEDSQAVPSRYLPETGFRPVFTPISEEDYSQLSPNSPHHAYSSGIPSPPPSGHVIVKLNDTSSPSASDLPPNLFRQPTDRTRQPLSPPRSRGASISSISMDMGGPSLNPAPSATLGRNRFGSAPTPIRVERDPEDYNSYNLTVSPGPEASLLPTPRAHGTGTEQQTFPETPDIFTPMWSAAASSKSPFIQGLNTPSSATLPVKRAQPSVAPHVLQSPETQSTSRTLHVINGGTTETCESVDRTSDQHTQFGERQEPTISLEVTSQRDSASLYSEESPIHSTFLAKQPSPTSELSSRYSQPSSLGIINEERQSVSSTSEELPTQAGTFSGINPAMSPPHTGTGSPPPYDTVVSDLGHMDFSPSTGDYVHDRSPSTSSLRSPSNNSMSGRRHVRPPGPMGPRRPSNPSTLPPASLTTPTPSGHRPRNPSESSSNSSHPAAPVSGQIKFNVSPVKWRGYTIEQAKWTFTSSQLQTIVSRAIRQSSDGTKIRLLSLDYLDQDVPIELRRLEISRTDIQAKYKILARHRAQLFSGLESVLTEGDQIDSDDPSSLLEELKDISSSLDQLTEALHVVDEQISQLHNLQEVHSASALALALRKLNTSFLRQVDDIKVMQEQIANLEVERDDAWKYAESEALKYDQISQRIESLDVPVSGSHRLSAARKSSVLTSRIGGRASSRRSSVCSNNRLSIGPLSSTAKSTFSTDDIPPVPRRPFAITTDLPTRSSMGVSSAGLTSNSDISAMKQAQDELYEMLGLNSRGHRRALSVLVPDSSQRDHIPLSPSSDHTTDGPQRPISLPDFPSQLQQNNDPEHLAMLKTLNILSSE